MPDAQALGTAAPVSPITYRIFPVDPGAHLFQIQCLIVEPDREGQQMTLPNWIPGSYLVRDFARHIVSMRARCNGEEIAWEKVDKSTWRFEPCSGLLELTYEVYANDLSVRGAHLDTLHGFFNGTSVFLAVEGREHLPCRVEIFAPEGPRYRQWRVATAMDRDGADWLGFGGYRAKDYDELIDHPVEMGVFTLGEYQAGGVPHRIAISGRHQVDIDRLCADLAQLCEHHIGFFGGAPMGEYWFLTMAVGEGYGGLEHRASSSLMCRRDELPQPGRHGMTEKYRRFLGLCSHEYFHLWNVKRIKPAAFTPYDLRSESYTRLLWVFEGITSYYDDLALLRSGLISTGSYLELLGQMLTRVYRAPGRHRQSVAESSFEAWTKLYKQDENSPNAIVSYYSKGAMIALALDMIIRRDTADRLSLDDVVTELWRRYGEDSGGVPESGFEDLAKEVTGLDFGAFFDLAVRGTSDLPMAELLGRVGVSLHMRPKGRGKDRGGKPGKRADLERPSLGVNLKSGRSSVVIANVIDGGAAHHAGLSAKDEIVAADEIRVRAGNFGERLSGYDIGDEVKLTIFRRDELMTLRVTLQEPALDTCYLAFDKEADADALEARENWLGVPGA